MVKVKCTRNIKYTEVQIVLAFLKLIFMCIAKLQSASEKEEFTVKVILDRNVVSCKKLFRFVSTFNDPAILKYNPCFISVHISHALNVSRCD